jgi:methylated-DNA-[protein]-cysteine S-methyltransferase
MKIKIIKSTPFGPVGIIWNGSNQNPEITRILLSKPGVSAEDKVSQLYPGSQASSCAGIDNMADAIRRFLEGENIEIPLDAADFAICTDFQKSVLLAEYAIPRGSVSTYRMIAEYLGRKNGARAVGNALANNPFPLIIPCHRAIRSDFSLGGYQGGLEMKLALLEMEGIRFDTAGRVICKDCHYQKYPVSPYSMKKK